jgi:AraC-like DNA-binding protein
LPEFARQAGQAAFVLHVMQELRGAVRVGRDDHLLGGVGALETMRRALPPTGVTRMHLEPAALEREDLVHLVFIPLAGACGTISAVTSRPTDQRLSDLARLRRVRDRIDREYAQPLDVEALARDAHMSAGHLSRQFRLAYGESPYSYLMTRRIERAMALLRQGDLSVTEVCFEVGCSSLGTFSTRFTELVGVPPSTYRREAAGDMAGMAPCVAKQVTRPIRNREAPAASRV